MNVSAYVDADAPLQTPPVGAALPLHRPPGAPASRHLAVQQKQA